MVVVVSVVVVVVCRRYQVLSGRDRWLVAGSCQRAVEEGNQKRDRMAV